MANKRSSGRSDRGPLLPQQPTFWARLGMSQGDPKATYGDEVYGYQVHRNSVVYAPSHLLAWCRSDELNTNSCRAPLDKSQHLGSAP
jgi:hypothetical protein